MKFIKRTLFFISAIVFSSITLASCELSNKNSSRGGSNTFTQNEITSTQDFGGNTAAEKILAYMNATYSDDKFEYLKPYGGQLGAKEKQILMKSEKFPDEEIWGYYNPDTDRDYQFMDNYVGIKYQDQVREKIILALNEAFGKADFVCSSSAQIIHTGNLYSLSFEEYISSDENNVMFSVIVDSSYIVESKKTFEESLTNIFKKYSVSATGTIKFTSDQSVFERLKNGEISSGEYFGLIHSSEKEDIRVDADLYSARENEFIWRKDP